MIMHQQASQKDKDYLSTNKQKRKRRDLSEESALLEKKKQQQLRVTWNKKGPSIAQNKLPDAFATSTTFIHQLPVPDIDKIVELEEQKQINQLLSPIKKHKDKHKDFSLNNINNHQQSITQQQEQDQLKSRKQNPLAPIKKYIRNMAKLEQQIENNLLVQNSIQELVLNYNSHQPQSNIQNGQRHLLTSRVKLDEMLTLDYFQHDIDRNTRRLLHVPSMTIYVIKEQVMYNKEYRKNLKEWVMYWQNVVNTSQVSNEKEKWFVKVYDTYWNQPEGRVSILMEYLNAGSLNDLLNVTDSLPLGIVKQLTHSLVAILEELHTHVDYNHFNNFYGGLAASQILFHKSAHNNHIRIQINVGRQKNQKLFYFRQKQQEQQQFNQTAGFKMQQQGSAFEAEQHMYQNISQYFTPDIKGNMTKTQRKPLDLEEQQKDDVFRLGIILLEALLGRLHLSQHIYLKNNMQEIINLNCFLTKIDSGLCCIIHSEKQIQQINNNNSKGQSQSLDQYLLLSQLLKLQCDDNYQQILCACLQINFKNRIDINGLKQMLQKQFQQENESSDFQNAQVNEADAKFQLIDFVKINMNFMNNNQKNLMNNNQLDKFIEQINMILGLCRKWFSDSKFNKYTGIWKEMLNHSKNIDNNNGNLQKLQQLSTILKVDYKQVLIKLNQINPFNTTN